MFLHLNPKNTEFIASYLHENKKSKNLHEVFTFFILFLQNNYAL